MSVKAKSFKLSLVLAFSLLLAGLLLWAGPFQSAQANGGSPLATSVKTVTPASSPAGGTVTYNIVLKNTNVSTNTLSVKVEDVFPQELTLKGSVSVAPGTAGFCPTQDPRHVVCNVGVNAGAMVTIAFQATLTSTVQPGDVITNTAAISDGVTLLEKSVALTVSAAPTTQIRTPFDGALFTQRKGTAMPVTGYAWDDSNDPQLPAAPVLNVITNNGSGTYMVTWSAVAGAIGYSLQESTSPYFASIRNVYDAATPFKSINGQPNGKYYYRVMAINADGELSRWSNTQSVTVGTRNAALPEFEPAAALPVVQVCVGEAHCANATVTQNVNGYWSWTYNWTLPEADMGVYTITARAQDAGGNWGEPDSIQVTVDNNISFVYLPIIFRRWPPLPYAPTLNPIGAPNSNGEFTVSWGYSPRGDGTDPTLGYTLQESTVADFSTIANSYDVNATLKTLSGKSGLLYYRVQGKNAYGGGEWSNVQSITIGFSDNFSNPNTGWARQLYKRGDGGDLMNVGYVNDTYQMKIMLASNNENNSKMGIAKSPYVNSATNYDVSVAHYFSNAEMPFSQFKPLEGKGGLIFAANESYSSIYVFEWNWEGLCAVKRYESTAFSSSPPVGTYGSGIVETPLYQWASCSGLKKNDYNQANSVLVEVRDATATAYVTTDGGKVRIFAFTDNNLRNSRRVGLVTGSLFWTPVDSRFDNFRVDSK